MVKDVTNAIAVTGYRRRWQALVALCVALFVVIVDNTVLQIALPTIQRRLGATESQLTWLVNAFVVAFAGFLLVGGALGDRFGRRRMLVTGMLLLVACAVAGAAAGTTDQLIAARAGMGIGAALVMPGTLSLLSAMFDGVERARAIAVWAAVSALGVIVGPLGGGWLVDWLGWPSVFLADAALGIVAVAAIVVLAPESRAPVRVGLDLPGGVLAVLALVALVRSLTLGPVNGWSSTGVWAGFAVSALAGAAFVVWELRTPTPLVPLGLLRDPRLAGAVIAITSAFFGLVGSTYYLTQHLQLVLGYSPLGAGMRILPVAGGLFVGAVLSPRLADRLGAGPVLAAGLCSIGAAMLVLHSATAANGYGRIGLVTVLGGLGVGLSTPTATNSVMSTLPEEKFGVGAGINDTTRELGGAIGVAVLNAVLAAAYVRNLSGPSLAGLDPGQRAAAQNNLGAALATAARLPDPVPLQRAATQAFVSAMHTGLLVAAGACFAGALAGGLILGRRRVSHSVLSGAAPELPQPAADPRRARLGR